MSDSMMAYLGGPMTGYPQFNFPAFDAAAKALRERGWEIISPAELDDPRTRSWALSSENGAQGGDPLGQTYGDYLARDVKILLDREIKTMWVLPKWYESRGARLESFVVVALNGGEVLEYPSGIPVSIQGVVGAWRGKDFYYRALPHQGVLA